MSPFEHLAESLGTSEHLQERLDSLPKTERVVIEWRYGFITGLFMSLTEVAQAIGLSRERVRQIEQRALLRMLRWPKEGPIFKTRPAPDR